MFPPRACGIGTFAGGVRAALINTRRLRPRGARARPAQHGPVVLLEHEYGIFGGRDGDYFLSLAAALTQPST